MCTSRARETQRLRDCSGLLAAPAGKLLPVDERHEAGRVGGKDVADVAPSSVLVVVEVPLQQTLEGTSS